MAEIRVTPDELLGMIAKELWECHGVSLFGFDPASLPVYKGSGTLVRVGGLPCILTAAHVREALVPFGRIALSTTRTRPAFKIDTLALRTRHASERDNGKWREWGPDIALVEIPATDERALEADGKSFYDLSRRRTETPPDESGGMWVINGAVGEETSVTEGSLAGHSTVNAGQIILGVTASHTSRPPVRGDVDFIDLRLTGRTDAPNSYGGLSGAAIWHVPAGGDGAGAAWNGRNASLVGMAYHELPGADGTIATVRAHARGTIYEHLLSQVPEATP